MKLSSIKVNSAAINGGAWVPVPWLDGVRFKVRGLENTGYQKRRADLIREAMLQAKTEGTPADQVITINQEIEAFVERLLIDWEGLTDDDGNPIQCTPEAALGYFKDPDLIDLWNAAYWASQQVRNAKVEALEEDKGN